MPKAALTLLLLIPAAAGAVPTRPEPHQVSAIFTASELNNLARLDEGARPANIRRMETEIAVLRDQVGRMKLEKLIDTVMTGDTRRTGVPRR